MTEKQLSHLKIALGLLSLFVLLATVMLRSMNTERTGYELTSKEANRNIYHGIDIPDSATKVSFRSNVRYTLVNFRSTEKDFLIYCDRKGWKPTKFDNKGNLFSTGKTSTNIVHWMSVLQTNGSTERIAVAEGLTFNNKANDMGYLGVFNLETKMAYIEYTIR